VASCHPFVSFLGTLRSRFGYAFGHVILLQRASSSTAYYQIVAVLQKAFRHFPNQVTKLIPSSFSQTDMNYTKCHFDFANLPWLTSPRRQLELQAVAIGLINLPPNEGYTFTHRHRKQEEVYIAIEGSGIIQVDDKLLEVERGDAVRVSPQARRALKAGEKGLLVICAGGVAEGYPENPNSRYMIDDGIADYDDIPLWYQGNSDVVHRNNELKKRQEKNRAKNPAR
jgi:mannose-6-phosphate isomerase-like protein (cupin superfamily)